MKKNFFPLYPVSYVKQYPNRATAQICHAAVSIDCRALRHVPEPLLTKELCTFALITGKGDASRIASAHRAIPIKFKTYEFYLNCCKENGTILCVVPVHMRDYQMCMTAATETVFALSSVPQNNDPECLKIWNALIALRQGTHRWIKHISKDQLSLHRALWEV